MKEDKQDRGEKYIHHSSYSLLVTQSWEWGQVWRYRREKKGIMEKWWKINEKVLLINVQLNLFL